MINSELLSKQGLWWSDFRSSASSLTGPLSLSFHVATLQNCCPAVFSTPVLLYLFLFSPSFLTSLLLCTTQAGLYLHIFIISILMTPCGISTRAVLNSIEILSSILDHKLPRERYYSFISLCSEKKCLQSLKSGRESEEMLHMYTFLGAGQFVI